MLTTGRTGRTTGRTTGRPGRLPPGVEQVVVGPGGVFVIGSSDRPDAVTAGGGVLEVDGGPLRAETGALQSAAALVAGLCGSGAGDVRAVLCLASDEPMSARVGEVLVCSTPSLVPLLTGHPAALSAAAVAGTTIRLDAALRSPTVGARAGSADRASRTVPTRARLVARVLVVVALLVAMLVAGAQVAGRMGDVPAPPVEPGGSGGP